MEQRKGRATAMQERRSRINFIQRRHAGRKHEWCALLEEAFDQGKIDEVGGRDLIEGWGKFRNEIDRRLVKGRSESEEAARTGMAEEFAVRIPRKLKFLQER